jgi:hypothetical protein
MLELYEPEATRTTMTVEGMIIEAVNCKVKYRFTQGKPADRAKYQLCLTTDSITMQEYKGSDLKPEGVMEVTGGVLRQMPESVRIYVQEGNLESVKTILSNQLTCPVR